MPPGTVDIVIGTHRLLSKDVVFKDLGLVIVDEEQRFGVAQKERLKELRHNVDVLTLTATPIPRTLHMSMIGVRDMSIIETPPEDRFPIRTYVVEYDDGSGARGDHAGAGPGGTGVLRVQPGAEHRPDGLAPHGARCRRPGSPSPTARWTRTSWSG